ncbi:unnamed protein product [Adineta ricciae]|uniref:Uncharacterized protein n=1 Tax=Adineta ricciae TaxID=249248 RepID=A0A813XAS3_ADIRI|nr:unnamed protein product [Adineta ricciae]CAF1449660.1 unnamed protein product [Adineta ricciae]
MPITSHRKDSQKRVNHQRQNHDSDEYFDYRYYKSPSTNASYEYEDQYYQTRTTNNFTPMRRTVMRNDQYFVIRTMS